MSKRTDKAAASRILWFLQQAQQPFQSIPGIAKTLDASEERIQTAVDRLLRLGVVEADESAPVPSVRLKRIVGIPAVKSLEDFDLPG